MEHKSHRAAQTALAATTRQHGTGGHATHVALHPERAAVASHLKHMHSQVTAPGMAAHPLTPSEGDMLRSGAEAVTRAANTVG